MRTPERVGQDVEHLRRAATPALKAHANSARREAKKNGERESFVAANVFDRAANQVLRTQRPVCWCHIGINWVQEIDHVGRESRESRRAGTMTKRAT
jgi:hypothetical protein